MVASSNAIENAWLHYYQAKDFLEGGIYQNLINEYIIAIEKVEVALLTRLN